MALFDKLKGMADKAKKFIGDNVSFDNGVLTISPDRSGNSPVKEQNINPAPPQHPLADEIEKKYYEIAYGLYASMGDRSMELEATKNYIEHCTGEACDEEKLQYVVKYFYCELRKYTLFTEEDRARSTLARNGVSKWEIEKIIETNRVLAESPVYKCSYEEAMDICYDYTAKLKEATERIEEAYDKVLSIVEANGVKFYKEGVERIANGYSSCFIYSHPITKFDAHKIIQTITRTKLLEGNTTVKNVLIAWTEHALWIDQSKHAVASVALRAAHFNQQEQSEAEYTGVTDEEYRNFVLTENSFRSEIQSNPYDVEELTAKNIDRIKNANIFRKTILDRFWMPDQNDDLYYADMVCRFFWNHVAQIKKADPAQEATSMYSLIFDKIQLSDEERQNREDYHRKTEEMLATRKQCDGCAFADSCQQKYKRKNCSAFMPK